MIPNQILIILLLVLVHVYMKLLPLCMSLLEFSCQHLDKPVASIIFFPFLFPGDPL